ncbi:MAG: endonuclease domain-containing protein [Solirubrobacterales bacterium]
MTSPVLTLIDLAAALSERELEAAVNDADKRGLVDPETLRAQLDGRARAPGIGRVRALLDRTAFRLTDSELERRFLRLVRSAKLPMPETGPVVAGFKVDFLWRDLRLVVETDGLRYHRTPASQARDRVRDQALAAAGMTTLRFTHAQVAREPRGVVATLRAVIRRLELER